MGLKRIFRLIRESSYKRKLFFSYLGVILLVLIILGSWVINTVVSGANEQAQRFLNQYAWEMTAKLDARLESYRKTVTFVVGDSRLTSALQGQDESYFSRYMNINDVFLSRFGIAAQTGEIQELIVYSSNELINYQLNEIRSLDEIRGKPWFEGVMENLGFSWLVDEGSLIGAYHIIRLNKMAPDNILYGVLKTDDIFLAPAFGELDMAFCIEDEMGNIILPLSPDIIQNEGVEGYLDKAGSGQINIGGKSFMRASAVIRETGWKLSLFAPKKALVDYSDGMLFKAIGGIVLLFLFLILLTNRLSNSLSARISSLNKSMQEVRVGNLNAVVEPGPMDEIGQLTEQFRVMLEDINRLIDEAYKSKLLQKEAELAALRSQIKPHFLYNTLSLINWMAVAKDASDISVLATNMTTYYRTMLNGGKEFALLRDELANARAYIEIQSIAHKDNPFEEEFILDEGLLDHSVLNMVLQPIVENGIKHGVDCKENGRGKLIIRAYCRQGELVLEVEDNGPGMDEKTVSRVLSGSSGGYGIYNVSQRLSLYAGDNYGISIESKLGSGTRVVVRQPLKF